MAELGHVERIITFKNTGVRIPYAARVQILKPQGVPKFVENRTESVSPAAGFFRASSSVR